MVVDLKKSIIELNDLEGRTIGVTSDDEFDYWLDSGLQNAGVNRQKVTTEYINKKDFGKKLANGKVDAVFAKYPDTSYVQKYANSEIQTMALSLQYHKRAHALLIGSNAYVNEKNGDTNKLLMALSQAQDHYENNKDLVRDSLPTIWEEEKSYIDNVLEDYEYRLQLNSEIFAQMDSQATWATAKGILKDDPDLKSIVNYSLLRKVRPEDVTL
jgi:ABC-type nitrate/sulfonate/bicarbonate transport system substrate-binding protein